MLDNAKPMCPECADDPGRQDQPDRRHFLRVAGGSAASLLVGGAAAPQLLASPSNPQRMVRVPRPAENLIRELYSTLTDAQRAMVVYRLCPTAAACLTSGAAAQQPGRSLRPAFWFFFAHHFFNGNAHRLREAAKRANAGVSSLHELKS